MYLHTGCFDAFNNLKGIHYYYLVYFRDKETVLSGRQPCSSLLREELTVLLST